MNNNEFQKLMQDVKNSSGDNNAKVQELMKRLNTQQAKQVTEILNNPEKSKEILNSPVAQALLKRLMK